MDKKTQELVDDAIIAYARKYEEQKENEIQKAIIGERARCVREFTLWYMGTSSDPDYFEVNYARQYKAIAKIVNL